MTGVQTCALPICLDREGVRLLSPRDSQILPKPFAGADDTVQVTQPSSRRSSLKIVFVMLFRFQLISSGAQLGRSGTLLHFGVVFILVP